MRLGDDGVQSKIFEVQIRMAPAGFASVCHRTAGGRSHDASQPDGADVAGSAQRCDPRSSERGHQLVSRSHEPGAHRGFAQRCGVPDECAKSRRASRAARLPVGRSGGDAHSGVQSAQRSKCRGIILTAEPGQDVEQRKCPHHRAAGADRRFGSANSACPQSEAAAADGAESKCTRRTGAAQRHSPGPRPDGPVRQQQWRERQGRTGGQHPTLPRPVPVA
jgi:hypothetical protein